MPPLVPTLGLNSIQLTVLDALFCTTEHAIQEKLLEMQLRYRQDFQIIDTKKSTYSQRLFRLPWVDSVTNNTLFLVLTTSP